MQAASCLREGEYCRLIRVSVIIVGYYVRFHLKLNLEAILESKAILLQKICSGHQNERIALGLCQPKFGKKLDCCFFISCNILIGSVTHVAGKFVTWASFTSSLKLQIHPRQIPRLEQQTYSWHVGQSQPSMEKIKICPCQFTGIKVTLDRRFHVGYERQIKKVSLLFSFGEN